MQVKKNKNWHNTDYALKCTANTATKEKIRNGVIATTNIKRNTQETKYNTNPNKCIHCDVAIPFSKRRNKFCCRSCSCTYNNLKRDAVIYDKQRISLQISLGISPTPRKINPEKKQPRMKGYINCAECGNLWYGILPRIYCSISCKRKNNYHPNSTRKITSYYNGYKMDSGAERKFAELLSDNNIIWHKNTSKYFLYIDTEGMERRYYPDFYLEEYDHWVEIKGKYYENDNDALKLKSVGNIEMIYSDNIRLPDFVASSPDDYTAI